MSAQRRRLFLDIETSQMLVWVWALHDPANQNISHQNIEREARIICVCWKWAGNRRVESLTWDENQCDKKLLQEFIPVLESATEVIAHNGNRFDIRWIRGRCLLHQIPMSPRIPTLDTLTKARQKFRLASHRLDYLSEKATGEGKIKVDLDLWHRIQRKNCPRALSKMVRYCKRDVVKLEQTYDWMAPYFEPITSTARYAGECPECGSVRVGNHNTRVWPSGNITHVIRCRDCGRSHTVSHTKYLNQTRLQSADL